MLTGRSGMSIVQASYHLIREAHLSHPVSSILHVDTTTVGLTLADARNPSAADVLAQACGETDGRSDTEGSSEPDPLGEW